MPGLGDVLDAVGSVAVNRHSFELFRETITRLSRESTASRLRAGLGPPDELTAYIVELHFNQLADESHRRFFNSVPTNLQLPPNCGSPETPGGSGVKEEPGISQIGRGPPAAKQSQEDRE